VTYGRMIPISLHSNKMFRSFQVFLSRGMQISMALSVVAS
jgi:hypothetical protein